MRKHNELRPVKIKRGYTRMSPGSVLFSAGNTTVLCTASVEPKVPDWLKGKGKGWITAEYNMLPHSTSPRKARERAKLEALGERSILVDCDVIEADGGTRTASITGAFIALVDCLRSIQKELPDPKRFPLTDSVAAISVGISDGKPALDLDS